MLKGLEITLTYPPGTKSPTAYEIERLARHAREIAEKNAPSVAVPADQAGTGPEHDPVLEALDQAERTLDKLLVRYEDCKQMAAALEHVRQTRHAELLFNPHRRRGPE